jgi:hypothetical protein
MTTPVSPPPGIPPQLDPADPVQMDLNAPLEVARWRVIGNPILAIPLALYLYVLNLVLGVITFIAWFAILFTGNYPEGMFHFAVSIHRFQWRAGTYAAFMRESYPTFTLVDTFADPGDDPATFSLAYPAKLSRGLIFIKIILVIPALFMLFIFGIGAYVAFVIGFFAVLFTGRWPEGLRQYIVRVARYGQRLFAYYYLLTDVYPGFALR